MRALVLGMTVACFLLAMYVAPIFNASIQLREQHRIGSELTSKGAVVNYRSGYVTRLGFNPGRSEQITDNDLRDIGRLTELEYFHLPLNKQITDKVLERMKPLAKLEHLNLISSPVTDAGLVHLTSHSNLKRLVLAGTQVTDKGLPHLYLLDQLEQLSLDECNVTSAALQKLQLALPNTIIVPELRH